MPPHRLLAQPARRSDRVIGADSESPPGVQVGRALLSAPWPKGRIRTRPEVDPKQRGSRPAEFEADLVAAIAGVRALAAAPAEAFSPGHSMFGPMTADDWRRWGYLHTDHHLRQFGL